MSAQELRDLAATPIIQVNKERKLKDLDATIK